MSVPDWIIITMEAYGKLAMIDDAKDFGKIRGNSGFHHWIVGTVLTLTSTYINEKRKKERQQAKTR